MHHVWLFLREFEVRTTFALFLKEERLFARIIHRRKRNIFWSPKTKTREKKQTVLEEEGEFFFSFLGGVLVFFYLFCLMKEGKDTPPRYLFLSGFALKRRERERERLCSSSVESGF
jgi:hypothetical protein